MQAVNSADQLSPSMGASASSNMNTGLQQAAAEAANACSGQLSGAVSNNPVNDFPNKMSSLGEVQRIIGLSLSKIQMGRNQRGGLPLHKNLLVATVLNKARDLYMQETMYMNYKMMTGQFAAAAASASNNANNNHGIPGVQPDQMHSAAQQHYHNYGNIAMANAMNHVHHDMADDDMEPVEANEADYDEDSESDVEDDCDVTSVQTAVSAAASAANEAHTMTTNHMQYPPTTMASMLSLHMHMQQQQMQQHELQQQQQQQQQQPQQQTQEQPAVPIPVASAASTTTSATSSTLQPQHSQPQPQPSSPAASTSQQPAVTNTNDEGFIDEPDCDCDARNFSTSESRVPFQYCYNCAPFHPSNGRGPTLVPSPCPSPTPPTATSNSSKAPGEAGGGGGSGHSSTLQHIGSCNPVIYDMDSQSTEVGSSEIHEAARGTKRRRSSGDSLEEDIDGASKKRRESTETSPDTSRDESGYQSDSSQHEVSLWLEPLKERSDATQIHRLQVPNSLFIFLSSDVSSGISWNHMQYKYKQRDFGSGTCKQQQQHLHSNNRCSWTRSNDGNRPNHQFGVNILLWSAHHGCCSSG